MKLFDFILLALNCSSVRRKPTSFADKRLIIKDNIIYQYYNIVSNFHQDYLTYDGHFCSLHVMFSCNQVLVNIAVFSERLAPV